MSVAPAAELRSGSRLRVRCGRMVHGGLCLAELPDGARALVAGAIPGEEVLAELRFRKGGTWFADTVGVDEASPGRVTPPCPHVPECGGCQLQHVDPAMQLALKRDIFLDAMRRAGVPAGDVDVIGMETPWRYRRRGEFHVVRDDAREVVGLGFNRARSWRPVAVGDCPIHDEAITDALPVLRELAADGGSPALSTLHVTLGDGGELAVHGRPRRTLDPRSIDAVALRMQTGRLSADATTITWRGHTYRVSGDTFLQVNAAQMEALYARVLTGLGDVRGRTVVDAYAGVGVLPVHLAAIGARVICVESNRAAARLGLLNAQLNDVASRVSYRNERAETALPRIARGTEIDSVILDPPRAGCAGAVTAWLALAGPRRLVYVSCDPATLARDLHLLVTSGPYALETQTIVDMFPQTYHIESVTVLARRA